MPLSVLGISKYKFHQEEIAEPCAPYLLTIFTKTGSDGFVFNTEHDINVEFMISAAEQYLTSICFIGRMKRCHHEFTMDPLDAITMDGRTLILARPSKRWNYIDNVCGYVDQIRARIFYSKPSHLDKIYNFAKLRIGTVNDKICYLEIPCLSQRAFEDFDGYFYD